MKRLTLFLVAAASLALAAVAGIASAAPHDRTIVVNPNDLANCGQLPSPPSCAAAHHGKKWFFYNDVNDTIDNTIGSFVFGQYGPNPIYDTCPSIPPVPACSMPPLGSGSVQISTLGSRRPNLATYQFGGTKLADITTLGFSTYNPSVGNGGSANRSGYLHFNVDFTGSSTSWQSRLVFVPSSNGAVVQNSWQAWDAINGSVRNSQGANWTYSGSVWPAGVGSCAAPASTPKTWAQILACYPSARILPGDSFLGIRVGEPYTNGYTENIDAFKFGTSRGTLTFDFDPKDNNNHDHGDDD